MIAVILNPVSAFIFAAIFLVSSVSKRFSFARLRLRVFGLVWLIYGFWEIYLYTWRSPTGDMAIRVDLVFLLPFLFVIAINGILILIRGLRMRQ